MAFFTRKGLTVPEFPALDADSMAEEEAADICIPTIPPLPLSHSPAYHPARHQHPTTAVPTYTESVAAASASRLAVAAATKATAPNPPIAHSSNLTAADTEEDDPLYDYVVDRTLGVEV